MLFPFAPIEESVKCCHLQTSISFTFLACCLSFLSFSLLPSFQNQQPAVKLLLPKKKSLKNTKTHSIWTFIPCKANQKWGVGLQAADVHVLVCKVPDCVRLCLDRKLAKKRKDAIGTTRQEMTHMVNAMDRSYADQSTLHGEDPMAVTFMDSHNYNNRCTFIKLTSFIHPSTFIHYLSCSPWWDFYSH